MFFQEPIQQTILSANELKLIKSQYPWFEDFRFKYMYYQEAHIFDVKSLLTGGPNAAICPSAYTKNQHFILYTTHFNRRIQPLKGLSGYLKKISQKKHKI